METLSEAALVHQAQQGDAKAFGQLYDRYAERVYRYLAFRLRDPVEAEDLTAETFRKAWQHIRDYRAHTAPWGAWLFRLAHNLWVDHWRRGARRATVALDQAGVIPNGASAKALAQIVSRADLERAIAQLTELQQQVIRLRFIADCSIAETARVMQRSEEAVKDLQHKGLAALRKSLGQ